MDLVAEDDREAILEERKRLIAESCKSCGVENFQCFGTSIWDETLYKAWSEIVTNLIPNIGLLETHLNNFCRICDADEVVLFERATFLVIAMHKPRTRHCQSDASSEGSSETPLTLTDSDHLPTPPPGHVKGHNTLIRIALKRFPTLSSSSSCRVARRSRSFRAWKCATRDFQPLLMPLRPTRTLW